MTLCSQQIKLTSFLVCLGRFFFLFARTCFPETNYNIHLVSFKSLINLCFPRHFSARVTFKIQNSKFTYHVSPTCLYTCNTVQSYRIICCDTCCIDVNPLTPWDPNRHQSSPCTWWRANKYHTMAK